VTYIIRRATPDDAATLSALATQTFVETFGHLYPQADLQAFLEESYAVQRQAAILANPDYAVWFLEHDGRPVGHAAAGPCGLPHVDVQPGDGELKRLYLQRAHHHSGWGGRLFRTVIGWLERGCPGAPWIGLWRGDLRRARLGAAFPPGTTERFDLVHFSAWTVSR